MSFIEEVKQSKAFKLIASYLGICFIILQVLDPLAERGIIEESLFRIIIYLIIAGIPIPLVVGFFSDRERVKLLNKKPNLNVIISIFAIFAVFYLSIKNIELRQSSERPNRAGLDSYRFVPPILVSARKARRRMLRRQTT